MNKDKRRLISLHTILIGVIFLLIIYLFVAHLSSFYRIYVSGYGLINSFIYYIKMFGTLMSRQPRSNVDFPLQFYDFIDLSKTSEFGISTLPSDLNVFIIHAKSFIALLGQKITLDDYLVATAFNISNFVLLMWSLAVIILLVFAISLMYLLPSEARDKKKLEQGNRSKLTKYFDSLEEKYFIHIKRYLHDLKEMFFKKRLLGIDGFYFKITLIILLFTFNIFALIIDIAATLIIIFTSAFELNGLFSLFIIIADIFYTLSPLFYYNPFVINFLIVTITVDIFLKSVGKGTLKKFDKENEKFTRKTGISILTFGPPGSGKTSDAVIMVQKAEEIMRMDTFDDMLLGESMFPCFDYVELRKNIDKLRRNLDYAYLTIGEKNGLSNRFKARRWISEQYELAEENRDELGRLLFFGRPYNGKEEIFNGMRPYTLKEMLMEYVQDYFFYSTRCLLAMGNIGINIAYPINDNGHLPLFEYNITGYDNRRKFHEIRRKITIANYHWFQLYNTEHDLSNYFFDGGVVIFDELDKDYPNSMKIGQVHKFLKEKLSAEKTNADGSKETMTKESQTMQQTQRNDGFKELWTLGRHAASWGIKPTNHIKLFGICPRDGNLEASLVSSFETSLYLHEIGEQESALPFFSLYSVIIKGFINIINDYLITKYYNIRSDKTVFITIIEKVKSKLHLWLFRRENYYGYSRQLISPMSGDNSAVTKTDSVLYRTNLSFANLQYVTAAHEQIFETIRKTKDADFENLAKFKNVKASFKDIKGTNGYGINLIFDTINMINKNSQEPLLEAPKDAVVEIDTTTEERKEIPLMELSEEEKTIIRKKASTPGQVRTKKKDPYKEARQKIHKQGSALINWYLNTHPTASRKEAEAWWADEKKKRLNELDQKIKGEKEI